MKSFKKPTNDQRGFTYVMVMFFIVMMGISLMAIGQEWSVTMKRDREAELLFRGTRIQKAIERYATDYQVQKSTRPNQYPLALKDLTKKPKRFLQAVYKDPITGKDFELIKTGGQIRGVRSTSQDKPYNQVKFKDAKTYHAIRFEAKASTGCDLSNPDPFSCPKG
ncbi:MAG: type II secretion system protein, partial [Nitrospirales bacterium]